MENESSSKDSQAQPSKSNTTIEEAKHLINPCACGTSPCSCTSKEKSYIYSLGRIEFRWPNLSLEKELLQAVGRADTKSLTDRQALSKVLSDPNNRYLARQICWTFTVSNIETYILQPRDTVDYDLLIKSLGQPISALGGTLASQVFVDLIVGLKGPISTPDICNGLMVPIVMLDQIYSFDIESLMKTVPRPPKVEPKSFNSSIQEVFSRILQMTDNTGSMNEHRAVNYLAVRFAAIYERAAIMYAQNFSLTSISVQPSSVSSTQRKIVDVIFAFTSRTSTFIEKYFVRVDVTDEFPFLASPLSLYIDR